MNGNHLFNDISLISICNFITLLIWAPFVHWLIRMTRLNFLESNNVRNKIATFSFHWIISCSISILALTNFFLSKELYLLHATTYKVNLKNSGRAEYMFECTIQSWLVANLRIFVGFEVRECQVIINHRLVLDLQTKVNVSESMLPILSWTICLVMFCSMRRRLRLTLTSSFDPPYFKLNF